MKTITRTFEEKHADRSVPKRIEDTYIWAVLDSNEEFLKEAEEAKLKPGEHYFCSDGKIYAQEEDLWLLSEHLILKYRKLHDPYVCEDDYDYPLDMVGSYSCESIIKKLLRGDFRKVQDFAWFSENDFDMDPDHNYIKRMKNAGLVQDIDFFILYRDPEGVRIEDIFMTENAWNRFIEKYPQPKIR